ncbi:helix-turn-helix transcriptional regulator [Salipaludibacillus agaradhaerens]|jgi:hypothetical protein|uniref:Helix-turn-helix transcriptional regulator n=1 Tax=Salipaludibacillus agaradhaerens TaxID=76935 RepID=A0A9Q4B5N8_SALAG|nr:hypothetical protein [Salipaludibacillus agaradhaerens]MCR6098784.1 helix-turn-helix transcriptional regulator [Salipaludibacillus agaradhaerens]MCR6115791.1 helix-turn-helix transcriptional regulator [Salipaludibacillus agaradhaerens]
MSNLNEITKLIFDDISYKIIKETSKQVLTRKELSRILKVPSSNLYYKINKLLHVDALRIKEQKQIGNLIENGYSSEHIFDDNIILNKSYLRQNFEPFLHYYLLNQKKMLDLLEEDLNSESHEDNTKIIIGNVKLSPENWTEFHQLVSQFLEKHESTDNDASTIELVITAAKEEKYK